MAHVRDTPSYPSSQSPFKREQSLTRTPATTSARPARSFVAGTVHLTIHTATASPSIPLHGLLRNPYRIGSGPDAHLFVPGFDTPLCIERVLVLDGDALDERLEVECLGERTLIGDSPLIFCSSTREIYVVIDRASSPSVFRPQGALGNEPAVVQSGGGQ